MSKRNEQLLLGSIWNNKKDCVCEQPPCPPISADADNLIECREDGIYAQAPTSASIVTRNSASIAFSGSGIDSDPLVADSLISPIQNGIVSGGEVTWIAGYTYSVSPATYYINGVLYTSPYTQITLDPSDTTNNRIDVFALTTSGTAIKITGTPSANPEQPAVNTATQLQTSFALVVANTTQPTSVTQEYIYRENIEWTATGTGGFNVASTSNPSQGTKDIEGTSVVAGNTVTLIKSVAETVGVKNVLVFYLKSKALWNTNRRLNFQFKNVAANVGLSIAFSGISYGFNSSVTASYQRIVIPLSDFGILSSDTIDRLVITASGTGGTFGFYIDDIELQGANLITTTSGTTDNVGVFYVSKNYSGIGTALINDYTISGITSTNGGYNTQLSSARIGDANKAYPCPWSARNAAMEAISNGQITKATIIVNGGNTWTYGSNSTPWNGNSVGDPLINETPDIQFGTTGDISSLAKNNIFYYFNVGSTLINICKAIPIHIIYNIDGTDTAWRSGFYGKGNFYTPYGTAQGLSQRFAEINNAMAEFVFESEETRVNRILFYVFNHKRIDIDIKNWYGDNSTSVVYEGNASREGDGSSSILNVKIDGGIFGNKYSPYPLATTNTNISNARAIFYLGGTQSNLREKKKDIKLSNMFFSTLGSATGSIFHGEGLSSGKNINLNFTLSNSKQIVDSSVPQVYNMLFNLVSAGGIYTNNKFLFNIKNFQHEATLLFARNSFNPITGNIDNMVTFNLQNVVRLPYSEAAPSEPSWQNTMINLPTYTGAMDVTCRPKFVFNCDNVVAKRDSVFGGSYGQTYPYQGNVIITGVIRTTTGIAPIYLLGAAYAGIVKDAILISGGAYCIDGDATGKTIYCKDVLSNVPVNTTNVTQQGTLTVDANISNYL